MTYSDEDLINDFIKGERKAYDEIYDRYYSAIVRFCFSFTRNMEDAKDITIGVLTILFRKNQDFESLPNIQAFLYITARNQSLNHLKSTKRLASRFEKYLAVKSEDFHQQVFIDQVEGELFNLIYQSIQELPPQCRRVMNLLYVEDLKYREVAEELDMTVKNVENLRSYALKKLRESLSPHRVLRVAYFLFVVLSSWHL